MKIRYRQFPDQINFTAFVDGVEVGSCTVKKFNTRGEMLARHPSNCIIRKIPELINKFGDIDYTEYFYIASIVLYKNKRNKGIGSQFLQLILNHTVLKSRDLICLQAVQLEDSCSKDKLFGFYEKNGFELLFGQNELWNNLFFKKLG
jgi:GNAT superfamily N-acetyltransferase